MESSNLTLNKIGQHLLRRGETISIAESVTSGSLQMAFSHIPQAEQFYKGGLTAYNLEQKVNLLNIDHNEAKSVNCVSRNISEQMALNVAKLFNTEWGIATTGFATPVEESRGEIYAYYGISYKGTIIRSDKIELHPMTKAVDAQNYFMEYVIGCLRCEVKREHFEVIA
ncbi:nicotinamide-nucleotide amidohydrolase family protein [Epilithonimonas sp.]|uniref:CinA family protein n=1 Tax=Epilithonimonas sp. TaxID=2894511 RepID=UPI00289E772D|nr:nicotinamide-nucleotide amidohydrolase family protein [Epilithonimonas sp.]